MLKSLPAEKQQIPTGTQGEKKYIARKSRDGVSSGYTQVSFTSN